MIDKIKHENHHDTDWLVIDKINELVDIINKTKECPNKVEPDEMVDNC